MRRELVARLLVDGAAMENPAPELVATAETLERAGLIGFGRVRFVRCAEPGDADHSQSDRLCLGQIYLDAIDQGLVRCPECGRLVYPEEDEKRWFEELRVHVPPEGVCQYIERQLDGNGME